MLADMNGTAFLQFTAQQLLAHPVFDIVLDSPLQRTGTELHIIALGGHELLSFVGDVEVITEVIHALIQILQLNLNNLLDGWQVELVEGDDLVQTVQELR